MLKSDFLKTKINKDCKVDLKLWHNIAFGKFEFLPRKTWVMLDKLLQASVKLETGLDSKVNRVHFNFKIILTKFRVFHKAKSQFWICSQQSLNTGKRMSNSSPIKPILIGWKYSYEVLPPAGLSGNIHTLYLLSSIPHAMVPLWECCVSLKKVN